MTRKGFCLVQAGRADSGTGSEHPQSHPTSKMGSPTPNVHLTFSILHFLDSTDCTVKPCTKQLHLTLAHKFYPHHQRTLEQLARAIQPSHTCQWTAALYSRDMRFVHYQVGWPSLPCWNEVYKGTLLGCHSVLHLSLKGGGGYPLLDPSLCAV